MVPKRKRLNILFRVWLRSRLEQFRLLAFVGAHVTWWNLLSGKDIGLSIRGCVGIVVVFIIMRPSFFFLASGARVACVGVTYSPSKLAKCSLNSGEMLDAHSSYCTIHLLHTHTHTHTRTCSVAERGLKTNHLTYLDSLVADFLTTDFGSCR